MGGARRDGLTTGRDSPEDPLTTPSAEAHTRPDLTAYAVDLRARHREGFTVQVDVCTWEVVVLRVSPTAGGASVFVAQPHHRLVEFMGDLDAGRRDADLMLALRRGSRRRLRRPPRTSPRLRMGVEHEFVVEGPAGRVDFGTTIDGLDLGVRADPTDPHAQRCPWGGVVTADGPEAEVATPPVDVSPGGVADVVALAATGRAVLGSALGSGYRLEGYSTHLNVSVPRHRDQRLAFRFATIFAPSLMLLLDRPTSPGLLVRPRPGRLELGGEFADGAPLGVALTFAIGATLAASTLSRRLARDLEIEVSLRAAVERYGWFVDRRAFGCDLYSLGREAPLLSARSGKRQRAGEHLERTWHVARAALGGLMSSSELAAVDEVIAGPAPLPGQAGVASTW